MGCLFSLEGPQEIASCYCKNNTKATYRFERIEQPDDIHVINTLEYAPKEIPELAPYCRSWTSGGILQYTACDECIKPELKRYFTYHPKGWMKRVGVFSHYETMRSA